MKLVYNPELTKSNKEAVYTLTKSSFLMNFKLKDLSSYVNKLSYAWKREKSEDWYVTNIDVLAKDPSRNLNAEFTVDEFGKNLKTTLVDSTGYKRIREYLKDSPNKDIKEIEAIRGKGISKQNGKWVRDLISLPGTNDYNGKNYYYDPEQNEFINDDGEIAPSSLVSDFTILDIMESARKEVTQNFAKANKPNKKPNELNDLSI